MACPYTALSVAVSANPAILPRPRSRLDDLGCRLYVCCIVVDVLQSQMKHFMNSIHSSLNQLRMMEIVGIYTSGYTCHNANPPQHNQFVITPTILETYLLTPVFSTLASSSKWSL